MRLYKLSFEHRDAITIFLETSKGNSVLFKYTDVASREMPDILWKYVEEWERRNGQKLSRIPTSWHATDQELKKLMKGKTKL